jgi:hypothetical protein
VDSMPNWAFGVLIAGVSLIVIGLVVGGILLYKHLSGGPLPSWSSKPRYNLDYNTDF